MVVLHDQFWTEIERKVENERNLSECSSSSAALLVKEIVK